MNSVRHGHVLMFFLAVSIGETAAVLWQPEAIQKPTMETIKNVPCHDGSHNKPATETIKQRFPATTETITRPATETSPKNTKNEESLDTFQNC